MGCKGVWCAAGWLDAEVRSMRTAVVVVDGAQLPVKVAEILNGRLWDRLDETQSAEHQGGRPRLV